MYDRPYPQQSKIRRGESPWRRLAAFVFDMSLFSALNHFVLFSIDIEIYVRFTLDFYSLGPPLLLMLTALPFGALMLQWTGTTPGKYLMGLSVVSVNSDEGEDASRPALRFTQLYKRGICSFCMGAGMMLSNIMPFSLFFGYRSLKYRGVTYWDLVSSTRVAYHPVKPWRIVVLVAVYLVAELLQACILLKTPLGTELVQYFQETLRQSMEAVLG